VKWTETTLGKCCDLYQPKTITAKELIEDGKYLVYGANGIIGRYKSFNHEESQLVIGCRGSVGSVHFTEPKSWITGNAMVIKPLTSDIDIRFLEYFFRGVVDLKKSITGTAQPQITRTSLSPVKLSYPNIEHQKKIVSKLDALFAEIEKAITSIELILKNAEALFQCQLRYNYELMVEKYGTKPISYFCEEIFAGGDVPTEAFSKIKTEKFQIPILANAVKDNGLYGYTNIARVKKPSLTIAGRGSGTGHTEIRLEPFFPIVRLIVLTPNAKLINLNFLKFSVQSLKLLSSGSAIPQLTIPMIKGYSIPNAPIDKQTEFTKQIELICDETNKIKSIESEKLARLHALKKSILLTAFNGELVEE
jgi:type I restriction enzyme S subunit